MVFFHQGVSHRRDGSLPEKRINLSYQGIAAAIASRLYHTKGLSIQMRCWGNEKMSASNLYATFLPVLLLCLSETGCGFLGSKVSQQRRTFPEVATYSALVMSARLSKLYLKRSELQEREIVVAQVTCDAAEQQSFQPPPHAEKPYNPRHSSLTLSASDHWL